MTQAFEVCKGILATREGSLGTAPVLSYRDIPMEECKNNECLVKVWYGGINYKDIESARGNPAITRRYPHILGSDIVGQVVESKSFLFKPGDIVFTCANQYGMTKKGLFRTYVNVLEHDLYSWKGFNAYPRLSVGLGTAGLTAGKAIMMAFGKDVMQKRGDIVARVLLVGGHTRVGYWLAAFLQSIGVVPDIVVSSSSRNIVDGAAGRKVIIYDELVKKRRFSLQHAEYDFIFDMVGGVGVGSLVSIIELSGALLVIGNMGGTSVEISLLPFFERGIQMIGVNAEKTRRDERQYIWQQVTRNLDIDQYEDSALAITPEEAILQISSRVDGFSDKIKNCSLIDFRNDEQGRAIKSP